MKVYLAARYSRKDQLREYAQWFNQRGIIVTSRWINGVHEWNGVPDEAIPAAELARFAREDLEDVRASDLVINFTEPYGSPYSRGGRHVEFGYALGMEYPCIIVGPRENIFHWHERILVLEDWDALQTYFHHVFYVAAELNRETLNGQASGDHGAYASTDGDIRRSGAVQDHRHFDGCASVSHR